MNSINKKILDSLRELDEVKSKYKDATVKISFLEEKVK